MSMHSRVYQARGDIGAIIHMRSPAVTGTDLGGAVDFPEGALDAVRAGIRRAL